MKKLPGDKNDYYPLTHAQKRIYYEEKKHPGTGVGTQAFVVRYKEALDEYILAEAINEVIRRNDGLRLKIVEFDFEPEPYQYVSPYRKVPLALFDFNELDIEGAFQTWLDKATQTPFQFIGNELFYFACLVFDNNDSGYYMKLHHIISDGWSYPLIFSEIDKIYNELKTMETIADEAGPSYIQYIAEEQKYLKSSQAKKDKKFWHDTLLPLPNPINLSLKSSTSDNIKGDGLTLAVPDDLRAEMHDYCKNHKTSIFRLILSGLSIYVSKVTGIDDFPVATANHNRAKNSRKKIVGMLASTIILRMNIDTNATFHDLVERVGKETNRIVKNHQEYPYDELATELREMAGIDTGFLMNISLSGHGNVDRGNFRFEHIFQGYVPNALTIHINYSNKDIDGILELEFEYRVDIFSESDVRQIYRGLLNVLYNTLAAPSENISETEVLSQEEKKHLVYDFNDTNRGYLNDKTIHELFEEQAEKTPENTALVFQNEYLTYKELDKRANQLGNYLALGKGLQVEEPVGILMDRSINLVVAMLGILKAGGAYVPIDQSFPEERIEDMITDASIGIVLSQSKNIETLTHLQKNGKRYHTFVCMDIFDMHPYLRSQDNSPTAKEKFRESLTEIKRYSTLKVNRDTNADNAAYIIYTSGSTGKPKGVVVPHRGISNFCETFRENFDITETDHVVQFADVSFDASVSEVYMAILNGAVLCMVNSETIGDYNKFVDYLNDSQISIATLPPPYANHLGNTEIKALRVLITAGSPPRHDLVKRWQKKVHYVNAYGPTETTICASLWKAGELAPPIDNIPIGKPINNINIYITNQSTGLIPIGIPGELCISGFPVARGYLNRPELTNEKFVQDPFIHGLRMYKTGDLARQLPDGNIEFLGRIDNQVKIRGFRVEPGEIENRMSAHPEIKEAVVVARKDHAGDQNLCAYITGNGIVNILGLRNTLAKKLPHYMLPSYFMQIEKIPLTTSGKVDVKRLPDPSSMGAGNGYPPPGNKIEVKLAGIWADVLSMNKNKVGIDDNFFELGGHSLKGAVLIAKIHKKLNVKLSTSDIFKMPTIRKMGKHIKNLQEVKYTAIQPVEKREYYPQSSSQKRLFVLQQMAKKSSNYNIMRLEIPEKRIERETLENIFKTLIKRHDSFRTSFFLKEGETFQKIHDRVPFAIDQYESMEGRTPRRERRRKTGDDGIWKPGEMREKPSTYRTPGKKITFTGKTVQEIINEFVRPFDLEKAPLLRVGLINVRGARQILLVDVHHIIADGMSIDEMEKEFKALLAGDPLTPLNLQYKDFAVWQSREREQLVLKEEEKFWIKEFEGDIPILELPADFSRPAVQEFKGETLYFAIDKENALKIKTLARQKGATLYMILLATFNVLLAKLCGQEEIIVGTVTAGRKHADLHHIIGMFANTLAIKNCPKQEKTFDKFLGEVRSRTIAAFENEDYPFEDLVSNVAGRRSTNRNPLFDVFFTFLDRTGKTGGFLESDDPGKLKPYSFEMDTAKFDMTLTGAETNQELWFTLEYNTKLFKEETIRRFIKYYQKITLSVTRNPDREIGTIDMIPGDEKTRLLIEFNRTEAEYPRDKTIHELFEIQAHKTPDAIALVGSDFNRPGKEDLQYITYSQLNRKANQLAGVLRKKGSRDFRITAVIAGRSPEMIIAVIGILKAGGIYLPIDSQFPRTRIEFILKDSNADLLLVQKDVFHKTRGALKDFPPQKILHIDNQNIYRGDSSNPEVTVTPESIAYIIYTSGTTGKPKGVLVRHKGICSLHTLYQRKYNVTGKDRVIQFAGSSFDASVSEIFMALLNSAALYLVTYDTISNYNLFSTYLNTNGITIMTLPPVYAGYLHVHSVESLRILVTAGSPTNAALVAKWREKVEYINAYGPTEYSICATCWYAAEETYLPGTIPIGKPINNTKMFILDHQLNIKPIGVTGELCISGVGTAAGYLNRPQLTAVKFIESPFDEGEKLYKTGDLTRRLPDGNIQFLGRIDTQVKIRGFRIELGEIENQLKTIPYIKDAVVIDRRDTEGEKFLCAFIVLKPGRKITGLTPGETLATQLPDYMIPAHFMEIDAVPLNTSGKVDRNALPHHEMKSNVKRYTLPGNGIEIELAEIWAGVLKIEEKIISIDDNFFDLGGHSMKAMLLVSRLHKKLRVRLTLADIFLAPTIKQLAGKITDAEEKEYVPLSPAEKREYYPQSSAQKRLFVLQQMSKKSTNYNIMRLEIPKERTDKEKLENIFKTLIHRHESFRTSFFLKEGDAVQKVHEQVKFSIQCYDTMEGRTPVGERRHKGEDGIWKPGERRKKGLDRRNRPAEYRAPEKKKTFTGKSAQEIVNEFVRPFDLGKAPLLRVGLITVRNTRQILLVDVHHIVSDGVSIEEMEKEFKALLSGDPLPPIKLQYKDFAVWQNSERERNVLKEEEKFWLKEFQGEIPILNLPADFPRPPVQEFKGELLHFAMSKEQAGKLKNLAHQHGATLYMILLAAFNVLLAKLSGQEEVIVGTVTAGRRHADLYRIIGMFVNTLALKNQPRPEKTFIEFLGVVKEKTIAAFENEDYQFEDLVSNVGAPRDTSRNPLFDVSFGFVDRTGQTGGLLESEDPGEVKPYSFAMETAKFDMTLMGTETPEEMHFSVEYNSKLFKEETVRRFIKYFRKIAAAVTLKPKREIGTIDMIPGYEKEQLLYDFNRTEVEYPRAGTIHELFEEQAKRTPDDIAVIGAWENSVVGSPLIGVKTYNSEAAAHKSEDPEGRRHASLVKDALLTYGELNEKVNQLAHFLRTKGVTANTLVGIITGPSVEMTVGILGILKAGGAYLPMDPHFPEGRINYTLRESGIRFLLTGSYFKGNIPGADQILSISLIDNREIVTCKRSNPKPVNKSTDMAYVIYTSGTTGRPKGVAVKNKSLVNYISWRLLSYNYNPDDVTLQLLSYVFDGFASNFYSSLISGGILILIPGSRKMDFEYIRTVLKKRAVTNLSVVPGIYETLLDTAETDDLRTLRFVVLAGEKAGVTLIKKSRQANPYIQHIIEYGPTETTVTATANIGIGPLDTTVIGNPISNTKIYILDTSLNLLPIGVPGEIFIAGDGVAMGYLNSPDLTAEKFLLTPYPLPLTTCLYRTGDLARWMPDGSIEFLGRIDTQIKIRGFRIEPGEIENQLRDIQYIKDAVVIDRENASGEKSLCAYLVLEHGQNMNDVKPGEKLAKQLPDYMIPAYFMNINTVPITPNGKLDRNALPDPKTGVVGREYEGPRNQKEKILAEIWEQVLGVEKISIDDDFFLLGGDSIKAIQIISRLQKQRLKLETHLLFRQKKIKLVAKYIKSLDILKKADIRKPCKNIPLTPIQNWFFAHNFKNSHHFNQSILLYGQKGFDETAVRKTISKITMHHDVLRMIYRYDEVEKKIIQQLGDDAEKTFHMEVVILDKAEKKSAKIKQEADRLQRSMDLRTGPLVKVCLIKGDSGDHLLIIIHHLVVDGVSWRILLEDFETGYRQAGQGKEIQLQQKTDPYHRWAIKLTQYAESGKMLEQLPFWKAIEETAVEKLPVDHQIGKEKNIHGNMDSVSMVLKKQKTGQLLTKVNWVYNTEINDILLTALGMAVNIWCGVENVLINLEGHGREKIMEDVDIHRTVGWFTSQYPVILGANESQGSENISFAIKNVKETLRRIPDKGAGYGILKYLTPNAPREMKGFPSFVLEPEISFNYLGQFDRGAHGVMDEITGLSDPRMGDCISPDFEATHKIDVSGEITGGTLKLSFFYNRYEYERDTMEQLVGLFKLKLEEIIAHCLAKEEKELTASDLGYTNISMETLRKITGWVKGNVGEETKIQAIYGLTPMQREIFYDTMLNKEAYFVQNILAIPAGSDPDVLKINISILNRRYETARTIFIYDERGEILQVVVDKRNLDIYTRDITHLTPEEQQEVLETFKKEDKQRGFDVTCDQLVRLTLFKTGEKFDVLFWSLHHIVLDGWCFPIIMENLTQLYDAMDKGISADLGSTVPFSTYVDWLELQDRKEGLEFWEDYLSGYNRQATLSALGSRGDKTRYQLEEYHFTIDEILSDGLTHRAAANQVTLNILFQTLWGILLQRYTGTGDVVFGAIVSGRPPEIEGIERMVGLFINIVPVRVKKGKTKRLPELLKKVQRQSLMAKLYDTLSLSEILEKVSLEPGTVDNLLFFENYPLTEEEGFQSKVKLLESQEQINYPFNFFVLPGRPIKIRFSYNGLVFNRELIQRIALDFQNLVLQVAENPGREIDELVNPG